MNRRTLLAAVGTTAGVSLSGCTGRVFEATPLHPNIRSDESGRQMVFTDGQDDLFQLSIHTSTVMEGIHHVHFTTWQETRLSITSITLRLRAPARDDEADHTTTVVVHPSRGDAYQGMQYYRDPEDPATTIINLPEIGSAGSASLSFDSYLSPQDPSVTETSLNVSVSASLSDVESYLTSYSASSQTTLDIPPTRREQ